ncbi:MAG TPA: GFA family protein [Acetobacteraceae bacterium]|nr:GFA family protein [Acetobacteraceae bacterium]
MTSLTGRCLCGAVAYEVSGPPAQVVHCHCESCRRHTSAPVATFLIVRHADFRYTSGAPKVYVSSPGVRRSFCNRCGSPMAYETDRRPDHIDLFVCSLSEPATVVPRVHVHAREQLPWFEILDDLPRYAESFTNGEPIRHGPRPAPS